LRDRPLAYLANAAAGLREMFGPSTAWHPRDGTSQSPHYQHRQVLGGYERWYNRLLHSMPVAPVGLYALVAPLLIWAGVFARQLIASRDPSSHARGALFGLLLFQIAYVVAASTMLTFLESSRYRFQIEWAIGVLAVAGLREIRTKTLRTKN
jgi:hypothetical protein